mmetsp:Transcript_10964/g.17838  ORF Transcript_10964/g.17838 Transcript_10964/m.17838 type:complete len:82 (+) Transcript_10964:1833-2078(+)
MFSPIEQYDNETCDALGEYLLNEIKDEDKAVHYFGKAISYYKEWGALAKVEQLMRSIRIFGQRHAKLRYVKTSYLNEIMIS